MCMLAWLRTGEKSASASTGGFRCPACGRSYAFRSTLVRHYRYECSATPVEPRFSCFLCPARFRRNERLTYHLRHTHGVVQNQSSSRRPRSLAEAVAAPIAAQYRAGAEPAVAAPQ